MRRAQLVGLRGSVTPSGTVQETQRPERQFPVTEPDGSVGWTGTPQADAGQSADRPLWFTADGRDRRRWRTRLLTRGDGAVRHLRAVALAAALLVLAACTAQAPADEPTVSPSPTASASATATPTATANPSATATPTPEPTTAAAPEEWTRVHTFGDGSARIVGGEIAHGDAGFLTIGHEYESGEGGPRRAGWTMWHSHDGWTWTELDYPVPEEGDYWSITLHGADDGSHVLHARHSIPGIVESPLVTLRSTNARSWEQLQTGLPAVIYPLTVAQGPNGYLLVAAQGAGTNPTLWLSPNGLSWELVHEFEQDEHFIQLDDGDGGAEGYVVLGRRIEKDSSSYERFAFASADGREWFERDAPFGPDDQGFVWEMSVSSRGGDWVATLGHRDETTSIWASANGLDWTEAGRLDARNLTSATGGLAKEVGSEVILAPGASTFFDGTPGAWSSTSTDNANWTPIDLGSADAWLGDLAIGDGVVALTGTVPGEDFTSTGVIWIRSSE